MTTTHTVPYVGVKMRIGKGEYIVPALSVRMVKRHQATLAAAAALRDRPPSDDEVDAMINVVLDALSRNYSELDRDAMQDEIDMRSLPDLLKAVTAQTGLEPTSGEAEGGH